MVQLKTRQEEAEKRREREHKAVLQKHGEELMSFLKTTLKAKIEKTREETREESRIRIEEQVERIRNLWTEKHFEIKKRVDETDFLMGYVSNTF